MCRTLTSFLMSTMTEYKKAESSWFKIIPVRAYNVFHLTGTSNFNYI